jgi:hypothetical protein
VDCSPEGSQRSLQEEAAVGSRADVHVEGYTDCRLDGRELRLVGEPLWASCMTIDASTSCDPPWEGRRSAWPQWTQRCRCRSTAMSARLLPRPHAASDASHLLIRFRQTRCHARGFGRFPCITVTLKTLIRNRAQSRTGTGTDVLAVEERWLGSLVPIEEDSLVTACLTSSSARSYWGSDS